VWLACKRELCLGGGRNGGKSGEAIAQEVVGRQGSGLATVEAGEHGLKVGVMEAESALVSVEQIKELTRDNVVEVPHGAIVLERHSGFKQWTQVSNKLRPVAANQFSRGLGVQCVF